MSKLLFVGDEYVELDPMGVVQLKQLCIREFPLRAFADYMGATITDSDWDHYSRTHLDYLNRLDNNMSLSVSHMNDILDVIPQDRVRQLRSWQYANFVSKSEDPNGTTITPEVRKALMFTMPMLACQCGSVDPAILYWFPTKSFKKADIQDWIGSLPRVSTGYDINTEKCAACTPRLYPQVCSSNEWTRYSTSDPSRCRCAGCGG